MSKYTEQADQFCEKHGVKIEWQLKYTALDDSLRHARINGYYYPLYRDVSCVTIKRGERSEVFEFTSSVYVSNPKIKGQYKRPKGDNYSILACLQKSDPGTLEEFCSEFGYDTDSRKALEIYLAVQQEFKKVNRLFHDVMDELQEIA